MSWGRYRVVQTVAVYLYAESEDDARAAAATTTSEWDDWELEHEPSYSKVEKAPKVAR
jgi:hypothetical protein